MFGYYKIANPEETLNYDYLHKIYYLNGFYYVKLRPGHAAHPDWEEITEQEFQAMAPPVVIDNSPPPETTEQKLARIEEQNLILMDALATTFEEVMALRAIVEGGTAE